jgi:hypothetical protein
MPVDSLAAALLAGRSGVSFRKGVVTGTSPTEVTVGGQVASVSSRLASYTPGSGDVVLLLVLESSIVILGKLVAP